MASSLTSMAAAAAAASGVGGESGRERGDASGECGGGVWGWVWIWGRKGARFRREGAGDAGGKGAFSRALERPPTGPRVGPTDRFMGRKCNCPTGRILSLSPLTHQDLGHGDPGRCYFAKGAAHRRPFTTFGPEYHGLDPSRKKKYPTAWKSGGPPTLSSSNRPDLSTPAPGLSCIARLQD